ncbi:uncharacterized protein [Centruroides vittatus]|uniref:uncharacterized protein n=1 Tax=Centruroides vittatus TaxID=120091 RepID=UPI00351016AA
MRKIAISILLMTYVSCTLANSFVKRSFRDVCALSRDQLSVFADCLDDSMSDESRDVVHGYMECLGFSSIFDYLEGTCAFENLDPVVETLEKVFSCHKQYAERLKTVTKKEDEGRCLEDATAGIVQ